MKTGYAIAIVLLAFAAGALLTGASAMGSGMNSWSPQEMWAACQSMMDAGQPSG